MDEVERKLLNNSAFKETMQSIQNNKEKVVKLEEDLDKYVPFERRV